MNSILFEGVCTAAVTPFTKDKIDFNLFEKQIEYQIQSGINNLCFLGTTGESSTINDDEYKEIITFVVEKVNKRAKIIIGSGHNCTKKAIEKSSIAEKYGANGLLVITPYYNKCTQLGLIKYYNDIANAVNIPIIAYNVPARTGVNILPKTAQILSQNSKICGIKQAINDIKQIKKTYFLTKNNFALYSGDDKLNGKLYKLGAKGCISVTSNVAPSLVNKLYTNHKNAIIDKKLTRNVSLLNDALFSSINPIPTKKALSILGLDSGELRPPLTELEEKFLKNLIYALYKNRLIGDDFLWEF